MKDDQKRGVSLADQERHEADHINYSRRQFIKSFGLYGGMGMMIGSLPISVSALSNWAPPENLDFADRILILIRLKGGNDGLNTLIPLDQLSLYHNARPQLAYQDQTLINLDGKHGLSPHLSDLRALWDDGMMKIINAVGYEDQNLSHFRSSDIWASSSDSDQIVSSGWVARYNESIYPDYDTEPPLDPPAIQIGGASSLMFNGEINSKIGFEAYSGEQLDYISATGTVHSMTDLPNCTYGDQLKYARALVNSTYRYVDRIKGAVEAAPLNSSLYDLSSKLAKSLMYVSSFIRGGLQTKIYVVELDGFDTHAKQATDHPALLKSLAKDVKAFYTDLKPHSSFENVLAVTFSEFGRRVYENAGPGTDHGAASMMFVFGKGVQSSGVVGDYSSLSDLDIYGNMKYKIDFKKVYATLLTEWLCMPDLEADEVLKHDMGTPLDLGFNCQVPSNTIQLTQSVFFHDVRYDFGSPYLVFKIPSTSMVQIELIDIHGRTSLVEVPNIKPAGEYRVPLKLTRPLTTGLYIYRIRIPGKEMTGKVIMP